MEELGTRMLTMVVHMTILVFHSNKGTYRQYRLKNNYDNFFEK